MKWRPLKDALTTLKIPEDYLLERLNREEIPTVINLLKEWYPDIVVGSESCHLSPDFYDQEVYFGDMAGDRPIFALTFKNKGSIIGFLSFEKNVLSRTVSARLATFSPDHRGHGLGPLNIQIIEEMAKIIGAELVCSYATLKIPHNQILSEKLGYKIVAIVPAFDRDMVEPGKIKRVYEALYAKVLVPDSEVCLPDPNALTPNTKALWKQIFGFELK